MLYGVNEIDKCIGNYIADEGRRAQNSTLVRFAHDQPCNHSSLDGLWLFHEPLSL